MEEFSKTFQITGEYNPENINPEQLVSSGKVKRVNGFAEVPSGEFLCGINNWIVTLKDGKFKFLLQQRSLKKKNNPGKWSSTNGLMLAEENDPKTTTSRETKEETGIEVKKEDIRIYKYRQREEHLIVCIMISFIENGTDLPITIQEEEVEKAEWMDREQILELLRNNNISSTCQYIEEELEGIIRLALSITEKQNTTKDDYR